MYTFGILLFLAEVSDDMTAALIAGGHYIADAQPKLMRRLINMMTDTAGRFEGERWASSFA